MVRHDTECIYTQGRVPVQYLNTYVEELVIHNTVLSSYIRLKLSLLLRMENWRNFVKNRLLLGGHAIVNSSRDVKLTVSYQTRVRPCLFLFIFRILLIFQILLLFTRLLFLSIAFSVPLTYLLTPWCRVLLEKLTGLQLFKKFPAFHGTRMFITALTSVRHLSLSWAYPIQSI